MLKQRLFTSQNTVSPRATRVFSSPGLTTVPLPSLQVREGNATGHIVKHLPPVRLQLVLPRGYPSSAAPEMSLTAPWLSASQTRLLTSELQAMAAAEQGLPMSFSLISWLQESALNHLRIEDTLVIHVASDSIEGQLPMTSPTSFTRGQYFVHGLHHMFGFGCWCSEDVPHHMYAAAWPPAKCG